MVESSGGHLSSKERGDLTCILPWARLLYYVTVFSQRHFQMSFNSLLPCLSRKMQVEVD